MIKYFKDSKGRFKEAYVYTNKNECLGCRTKGIAEYIDTLEKALDKACDSLAYAIDYAPCTTKHCPLSHADKHQCVGECLDAGCWKEYLLKEVQEDE